MWERGCEGGCGLDGTEEELADVVGVVETEGAFDLVDGDAFSHADDVLVEGEAGGHVLGVCEDEGFVGVETDADDVFGILFAVSAGIFDCDLFRMHKFLIVGQLNDKGAVEDILEILGELEGDGVTDMHALAAGTSASIEEEGLAFLIPIQDYLQLAMGQHHASPHEAVCPLARDSLETLQKLFGDQRSPKVPREFLIVHRKQLSRGIHSSRYFERGDLLLHSMCRSLLCKGSRCQVGRLPRLVSWWRIGVASHLWRCLAGRTLCVGLLRLTADLEVMRCRGPQESLEDWTCNSVRVYLGTV